MAITIDIERDGEILVARCEGELTSKADEQIDRSVASACEESGCSRVLVDMRSVTGMPQPAESFESGTRLGERGFKLGIRIAFVDLMQFKEANDLYELVASNRGYQVRHFYTLEEARVWLTQEC